MVSLLYVDSKFTLTNENKITTYFPDNGLSVAIKIAQIASSPLKNKYVHFKSLHESLPIHVFNNCLSIKCQFNREINVGKIVGCFRIFKFIF